MTLNDSNVALLALLRATKPAIARELLQEHGDVLVALRAATQTQMSLEDSAADELGAGLDAAMEDLVAWQAEGIDVVTVLDEGYPANLRTVHDRPLLLTVRGSLRPDDDRSVAVAGTRAATDRGLDQAQAIARGLVAAGYVVVSGLAAGIDRAAHVAALEAGGRTVAVIGTGQRHAFPKENAGLQAQIAETSAVVSQFWPDQGPRRHTFPMRNAVMSGLARATVVVEASYTSGAKMQARLALEHGRPVVLLRSLVDDHKWARDYAARPGVYVVDDVSEVLDRLDLLYADDLSLAL